MGSFDLHSWLLGLIAFLAVAVLASPRASISSVFLFFESLLLIIHFVLYQGAQSKSLGAIVLISFFILVVIGVSTYIELAMGEGVAKSSKINTLIGMVLLLAFFRCFDNIVLPSYDKVKVVLPQVIEDKISFLAVGLSLFFMLMAAFIIFALKREKSGGDV